VPILEIKTVAFVTFTTVAGDLNEPLTEPTSVLACMAVFFAAFFQTSFERWMGGFLALP